MVIIKIKNILLVEDKTKGGSVITLRSRSENIQIQSTDDELTIKLKILTAQEGEVKFISVEANSRY